MRVTIDKILVEDISKFFKSQSNKRDSYYSIEMLTERRSEIN